MRVTQNSLTRNYLRNMNTNLARLAKSQERMLGDKYAKASENLADTSRAMRVRQSLNDNEAYATKIRDVAARLSSAESNITSMNDILVTAREEIMEAAANDTDGTARDVYASQIESLRDEIIQFANAQYAGNYLFGGSENGKAPFDFDEAGNLTYHGIDVNTITYNENEGIYVYPDPNDVTKTIPVPENQAQYVDIGLGLVMTGTQGHSASAFKITFSGLDILGCDKNADGLSNNVINLLTEAAKLLNTEPLDHEAFNAVSNNLKTSTESLRLNLTDIGTRCDFLDKTSERIENDIYNLTELQQKLEVADTAEESSNWKTYRAVMIATYQMGSQVLPMSLMDFIQ